MSLNKEININEATNASLIDNLEYYNTTKAKARVMKNPVKSGLDELLDKKNDEVTLDDLKKMHQEYTYTSRYVSGFGRLENENVFEESKSEKLKKNTLIVGRENDKFIIKISDVSGNEMLRFDNNGDIYVKGNLAEIDAQVVDAFRVFLRSGKFHP